MSSGIHLRQRGYTFALIFALVPTTLRSGPSHTTLIIRILVASQANQWMRSILFHSCGGIRRMVILYVQVEVQWMGSVNC